MRESIPTFAAAPSMTLSAPASKPSAAAKFVSAALAIAPIRRAFMALGRRKVVADARRIGVPWEEDVAALQDIIEPTLEPLRAAVEDADLVIPEYYKAPFHAYVKGNIGWMPALEAEVSSNAVHAKFAAVEPLEGDGYLRNGAADIICARWQSERPASDDSPPSEILDVGCSVGLSSIILKNRWPSARVVGLDPSAEMLAVGMHRRGAVKYIHGLGERIPDAALAPGGFDIVTVQLVVHELPDAPTRAIFDEAMRVLEPGGMLACMDVNPAALEKVPPVFLALFQSTEPYFEQFAARDIAEDMARAGFEGVEFGMNTPRHRTFTAFKPRGA